MAAATRIDIDNTLLEGLRARHPGKRDRQPIEDVAKVHPGDVALRETEERNAHDAEDAGELGVRAVHETRRTGR
jgi:hypothetical protein